MEKEIRSLLIIGLDVTSLAKSANRAGYDVYSVDYFGDTDLRKVCRESSSVIVQQKNESYGRLSAKFDPENLLKLAKTLSRKHKIDGAVLSSGLEDFPKILSELNDHIPILGNNLYSINRVRDKNDFFQELDRLRIPHPTTDVVENPKEAFKKARDIGYPVVVKPAKGFGGTGLRKVSNPQRLDCAFKLASSLSKRVLIQEYIQGIPASASLMSIPGKSIALTINEQLIGVRSLGQREPFGYCGNIVPLSAPKTVIERCKYVSERIATHYGLIGSNGVDFVLSKEGEPKVVEVNPRFQGTLECVERVLGINVLEAHVEACVSEILPKKMTSPRCFCTRLILFAKKRSKIQDLMEFKEARDIPLSEVIVEQGEPICSIITEGSSRENSFDRAKDVANSIYVSIHLQ